MIDTMIFVYFQKSGHLDSLLELPDIAITSSVRRELRGWPTVLTRVEAALENGALLLEDIDPSNTTEGILYQLFYDRDGFGDGEAASMAVANSRSHSFVSHDLGAASKIRSLGVKVTDWPEILAEIHATGKISQTQYNQALRKIRSLMSGR